MDALANRIRKRRKHLGKWARREKIQAYRVYDHDLPEAPAALDVYGPSAVLYVSEKGRLTEPGALDAFAEEARADAAQALDIDEAQVFPKIRRRQMGRKQYERLSSQSLERVMQEGELRFLVNLSDYLDTGLFLDHRPTRRLVAERARGLYVLNLFSYTGSFSIAAAAGGAGGVVSVDLSNTYQDWARHNAQLNAQKHMHQFERGDVLAWLERNPRPDFDLIICDPPSFSNSKAMDVTLDIQRDHPRLIVSLFRWLAPGGRILFSTNRRGFSLDEKALGSFAVQDITRETTSEDFARRPAHKAWWIQREG